MSHTSRSPLLRPRLIVSLYSFSPPESASPGAAYKRFEEQCSKSSGILTLIQIQLLHKSSSLCSVCCSESMQAMEVMKTNREETKKTTEKDNGEKRFKILSAIDEARLG